MTPARATDAREVGAGCMFLLGGLGVIAYARLYDLGTATNMGPGYFPTLLGILLVLLGGVAVWQGLRRTEAASIGAWPVVPTLFVLGAVLVFSAMITAYGLVPSVAGTVLLACYERLLRRPLEVALIIAVLVLLTTGVFFYGIQLPFRLW